MSTDMNDQLIADIAAYIGATRWFAGKGRDWQVSSLRCAGELPGAPDEVTVRIQLAEITYADGVADLYQVPLAYYAEPQERLVHALVGEVEDEELGHVHVYDALHDRDSMALWLQAFADDAVAGDLHFERLAGHDLDLDTHSTLFRGEQSNSSVAFGEDSLMKVFRKVTPGLNPDISVHRVLTEAGSDHVAALYGWLDLRSGDETLQLAMLQQFLRTASDGWDLALGSVRDLFAEADLHAEEVGGDFAGEASRLGVALAEVHDTLRQQFDVGVGSASDLAAAMRARLDAALDVIADLREHESGLRAVFDQVGDLGDFPVQQIHGDLHLGQTLRTVKGWKIVDFEGEPAKPLSERVLPDSPWRDVAGMLRSFDYAPRVVSMTSPTADESNAADQLSYRAAEWSERNGAAFLDAYVGAGAISPAERTMLDAYVIDKAIYEAVYEARNRPTWLPIPLAALARIAGSEGSR